MLFETEGTKDKTIFIRCHVVLSNVICNCGFILTIERKILTGEILTGEVLTFLMLSS